METQHNSLSPDGLRLLHWPQEGEFLDMKRMQNAFLAGSEASSQELKEFSFATGQTLAGYPFLPVRTPHKHATAVPAGSPKREDSETLELTTRTLNAFWIKCLA